MNKFLTLALSIMTAACTGANPDDVVLITLDPGHFHAALVQKSPYPGVSSDVYVYAPEGNELQEHLKKIEDFNTRAENPTSWNEIVYTGDDFFEKMTLEKKGNVMVTAGDNRQKTEYILNTLKAGINVLADKPMVISSDKFGMLEECFRTARENGLLLYDIMTERFEISTILQKEISGIRGIFGEQIQGTPENPGITIESVHHFYKNVSGKALIRPAWFYDVTRQGESITDVMVHLVDLVQWECFPGQILDYHKDIDILNARHWTTPVTTDQFRLSTGLDEFPDFLLCDVNNDTLNIFANGEITYTLKGLCARTTALWAFEPPAGGGDTHYSTMRGTRADLLIKQGPEQNCIPELFIEPHGEIPDIDNLFASVEALHPGISLERCGSGWHVIIPDSYRTGHEAHFGQVTADYLEYLRKGTLPEWEVPGMLAKYYTTTTAWKMAQKNQNL